ncbi:MAG TPA: cytochrome c biogenesis heme-transporting ATPase CcmA [Salinisphaeraceae bacterium]|nr:cytochrome c biogenesis heme-transporting ATPase CcmA [Salinisphaeraceae bacterium]
MPAAPLLVATDLVCGYAEQQLFAPVSFALSAGQALQITGANGRGKTTLFRTVVGLQRPLAGAVRWQTEQELADELCFIGHANALNDALTPLENLQLLLRLNGRRATSAQEIRATLELLGLTRLGRRPCERLSAGQRRRVALARLWLTNAPFWVLDEPAAALDVDARAALCAHLAAHVHHGGMLLFTTHEPLDLPGLEPAQIVLEPC